jgi:hypothetical protein
VYISSAGGLSHSHPNPAPGARPARGRLPPRDPIALSKLYASARATMRGWRIEEAALGPRFRRWGVGRGGRAGLQSVATSYRRAGRGGRSCNLFQNVSILPPRPAREATLGRVAQRQACRCAGQALRALRERGDEAKTVQSVFGSIRLCSVLFRSIRSGSFEVKLMEEFLKHPEIASARRPGPTVGGNLRQIATEYGGLRQQPKPRRHSAADHGRVRRAALRTNRETSPGEIHGS